MICFEVSVNGRKVCTAGIGDQQADMTAVLCSMNAWIDGADGSPPTITLDVRGAADETQMVWLENFGQLQRGDTVTLQIVESDNPDAPRTQKTAVTLQMSRAQAQDPDVSRCCFCHRAQSDTRKLIAGPPVFVCNECVSVCNDILEDQP
jgi:hypothetical protein